MAAERKMIDEYNGQKKLSMCFYRICMATMTSVDGTSLLVYLLAYLSSHASLGHTTNSRYGHYNKYLTPYDFIVSLVFLVD